MKKKVLTLASSLIMSGALYAQDITLNGDWQLLGALSDVNETALKNATCFDYAWQYDSGIWKLLVNNPSTYAYTGPEATNIAAGEGFWVKSSNGGCLASGIYTESSTNTNPTGFIAGTLQGKTSYSVTIPVITTTPPYTGITTFHYDGTRSFSKNGGNISNADYEINDDGTLHVTNTDTSKYPSATFRYDWTFEIIDNDASSGAISTLDMNRADGTKFAKRLIFDTQAKLDTYLATLGMSTPDNSFNMITTAATTLSFNTQINAIAIEDDDTDYYNTVSFTGTSFSSTDYEYDAGSWNIDETFSGTMTKNTDQNASIIETTENFHADVIIKETKQITSIDGTDFTDLYISDVELHVTQVGSGWSDSWGYFPKDDNENPISNIALKNLYIQNNHWFGDGDYAMLGGLITDTSGVIVKGTFDGFWQCQDGTSPRECSTYSPTDEEISNAGWTSDANGIYVNLPQETLHIYIHPTSGEVTQDGQDADRSVWTEQWFTGTDATEANVRYLLQPSSASTAVAQ